MPRPERRLHLGDAFVRYRHVLWPTIRDCALLSGDGSEIFFPGHRELTQIEELSVRTFMSLAFPRLPLNPLPRRRNADRRLRPIT